MKNIIMINLILMSLALCNKVEDKSMELLVPVVAAQQEEYLKVVDSNPVAGALNVDGAQDIVIVFNQDIEAQKCTGAFSITPFTVGNFSVAQAILTYNPQGTLADGTYVITITKDCEDLVGRDLVNEYTLSFGVGAE